MKKLIFSIIFLSFSFGTYNQLIILNEEIEELELTIKNVYDKILEYDIQHPEIVFSQVILETGHLKSGGALNDNNLFGFTTRNGHMKFEHWEESIIYYKDWQDKRYDDGNYFYFLTNIGYAEDSLYIQKITQIHKTYFIDNKYEINLIYELD